MDIAMSRRTLVSGAIAAFAAAGTASAFATEQATVAEAKDWLGSAPEIDESSVVETIDVDVLVAGAGQSGTPAAYFAAAGGAETLLIEKGTIGVQMRQSAFGAVGSKYQMDHGVEINREELLNDIAHYALNQCDLALWRNWLDHSAEAVEWYGAEVEKAGHRIWLEYTMPPAEGSYKYWPTGHGTANMNDLPSSPYEQSNCMGDETAVWETIRSDYEALGGKYRNCTALVRLIQNEQGAVVGAYATNADGEYIRINTAKGVVVATGGYMDNGDMYESLQGGLHKSLVTGSRWGAYKGDGIKALLWAGARKDAFPTTMVFDRCNVRPDYELGGLFDGAPDFNYFHFASQPFLKVDCKGKRLCNESSPYDFVVHAAAERPDHAWYEIWDSSWMEDAIAFQTIGCSTVYFREGSSHQPEGLDAIQGQIDDYVEKGYVIKADTIEGLAEGLGLPVETFSAEVERYNSWCADGYDGDFGKEAYRLTPVDEPPYYGMKLGGMGLCTLDGIVVNEKYQPLDEAGNPIEGVYVVGNDCGCHYAHTYPNFAAGLNAGRCSTSGMLVGKSLAQS